MKLSSLGNYWGGEQNCSFWICQSSQWGRSRKIWRTTKGCSEEDSSNGKSIWCLHWGTWWFDWYMRQNLFKDLFNTTLKLEGMEKKAGNAEGEVAALRYQDF